MRRISSNNPINTRPRDSTRIIWRSSASTQPSLVTCMLCNSSALRSIQPDCHRSCCQFLCTASHGQEESHWQGWGTTSSLETSRRRVQSCRISRVGLSLPRGQQAWSFRGSRPQRTSHHEEASFTSRLGLSILRGRKEHGLGLSCEKAIFFSFNYCSNTEKLL